jgi:HD-GYP domain-containing protein (c-di-GMP phosphodiesterase class II)
MTSGSQAGSLKRYWSLVVVFTAAVAAGPIGLVTFLESRGLIHSLAPSVIIGVAVSLAIAAMASRIWMAWFDTADVVFGDLLLWGWLRRLRHERRVTRSARILGLWDDSLSATGSLDRPSRLRVLKDLARALEARDSYTHGHSRRVERHSYMIAKAMDLPASLVESIRIAASVHDVGKLDLPLKLLRKPGRLTDPEFELIKSHASRGADMVAALDDAEITRMVRHHHERLDGKGYPNGLTGDEIPIGARVIAAADTFDAIVSSRAYRGAARHKHAIEIMKKEAGTQLDPEVVVAFLSYYSGRSSFEWWASVSTLPQRALRLIGLDASSTAVAQGAVAVTAGVMLAGTSIVPWAGGCVG